jgi:NAD(P)-dependent dehydrogenase (short-subunit alcohol dehydrogenase family)
MALFDKVAVITGGASGIGRAVALEFAKNGATLVIGDINENEGEQTLKLIAQQNLPRRNIAIFQRCDVTQKDELTGLMNNGTVSRFLD